MKDPFLAPQASDERMKGDDAASRLQISQKRQHQGMGIDDAGGGRPQCSDGANLRLHRRNLAGADDLQIMHAGVRAAGPDGLEPADLRLVSGDDQLAAAGMGDASFGQIGIEPVLAGHAEPRLQRTLRIVEAGMDDLAVARGCLGADPFGGLDHQHLAPGQRQRPRDGEADDAGPDHHALDIRHAAEPQVRGIAVSTIRVQ